MAQDPERLLALFRTYYDLRDKMREEEQTVGDLSALQAAVSASIGGEAEEETKWRKNPAFRDAEHHWYNALRRFLLEAAGVVESRFNARNRVRADELAEKVLVDVMKKIRKGSFQPDDFTSSWGLTSFLRQRLRWHANDNVKREERELTNFQDILDGFPESDKWDALTTIDRLELERKVEKALYDIDSEQVSCRFFGGERCGQMIKWHFFDKKTYRQIAEELNVSAAHVHDMVKRGLKFLQNWLRDC